MNIIRIGERLIYRKNVRVRVKFRGVKAESAEPIKTRYVKVEVTGTKECPTWHYGVGHPSWFFIDEVIIKKKSRGGDVSSFPLLVVLYIDGSEKCFFFHLYTMIYATE